MLNLLGDCALAQITPDGTLGAESSVVTPTNIDGFSTERIDGGATRGANLFHSFEQFSIPTGGRAYFNNALDIQNIFSRVTGGSISNINGLIRANASANLFLLNPNGIIFGPNATLAIGGSFVGSTASSINFADGTQFSATTHPTTPLLTVSVPIGLQYGGTTPGSILNQSQVTNSSGEFVGLQVPPGKTLTLVGGDVRLDGGNLFAPGGQVELGGVAGAGTVGLNVDSNNLRLSFPNGVMKADVSLTNGARVNVRAGGGGSIAINSRHLNVLEGSKVRAGIESGWGSPDSRGGDIEINAQGAITIADEMSFIANAVRTRAVGKGGDVNITTGSLFVTNGGQVNALTQGQGDAGSVTINARDTVSFDGLANNGDRSGSFSTVASTAVGNGGTIDITARSFSLTNHAVLNASTYGQGNAGSIFVQADDSVSLSDGSFIVSTIREGAMGDGGDINIQTRSLSATNSSQVQAAVFRQQGNVPGGQGKGGNILVNATDSVYLSGFDSSGFSSGLLTITEQGARGQAGNITVNTGDLRIANGADVNAATRNSSDGGNIVINANTFEATNGGQVRATSRSSGKAGNITLNATDITLSGSDPTYKARIAQFGQNIVSDAGSASGLFASTTETSTGLGGDLKITTGQLVIQNGAQVTVSSQGSGGAGNLEVVADSIRLENQGQLSSDTMAGQGNIILNTQDLVLRRGSNITTNAQSTATGGNITINTSVIAALENSDITADAEDARGGRVIINAQGIFRTEESDITATSSLGPQFRGTVEINTPDFDSSQGLVALPSELVDASVLIASSACGSGERQRQSEFIITGRGGLPWRPGDAHISHYPTGSVRSIPSSSPSRETPRSSVSGSVPSTNSTGSEPVTLIEAQGWAINDQGVVVLTAHAPNVTPHIPWLNPANCHTP